MPKPTKQSLLITALTARGYVPDTASRVTRFKVFRPTPETRSVLRPRSDLPYDLLDHRIYSGKMGALRFSRRGVVANSVPLNPRILAMLIEEATRKPEEA